jgi:hypothetical protein
MGDCIAMQPPWSVALNTLKDRLLCNMVFNALKDWLLRNILGAWSSMHWRIGCYATSSEHGLQCIEGLVAMQHPRSMVFNALKDWLLCNLLGAWSSMHWRIGCYATSSEHGLQCIEGLVASQHPRSMVFWINALKDWLLHNILRA